MPRGKSRFGLAHSSAVVEMASKPIYAKKTDETPRNTPDMPFGKNGDQLLILSSVKITQKPTTAINASTNNFSITIKLALFLLSLIPMYARKVTKATIRNAGKFSTICQPPIIGAWLYTNPLTSFPCNKASS